MNNKEIIKQIIKNKGLELHDIINLDLEDLPDPSLIPNIKRLELELITAQSWGSKIFIVGDWDVDGVTSSTILYSLLKELELDVEVKITTRELGYGLSKELIDYLYRQNCDKIITVDCGITQDEEIKYANSLGINVFVIDHHNREEIPLFNYIDLKVKQGKFPTKELSTGGLCYFIYKYFYNFGANKYLDLAALSTVADLVDMSDKVNRTLVKYGLKNINNEGLKKLISIKRFDKDNLKETNISYGVAPMINAVGRLGDNQLSFNLLNSNNDDKINVLANQINQFNKDRQKLTKDTMESIEDKIDATNNIIIHQLCIHKGISGLVAGKLMDKHNKPVIILNEEGRGSGRSLSPLDLQDELQQFKHLLEYADGHSKAFGIYIGSKPLEPLREALYELTEDIEYEDKQETILIEDTDIINMRLYNDIRKLAPFGMGFEKPMFKLKNIFLDSYRETSTGEHLQLEKDMVKGIWFNYDKDINLRNKINIIFELGIDKFSNDIQMIVRDMEEVE